MASASNARPSTTVSSTKFTGKSLTRVRRSSAQKVLLSSRSHIDSLDAGLTSVAGAREVIAMIKSRKSVVKLILGHNELGDDGTRELFRFLCTDEGRKYRINEISLNANSIGDRGLEGIIDYLTGNTWLTELFLQNNSLTGSGNIATRFATAVNSSKLGLLSLVTNQQLSDNFLSQFLATLSSSTLHELHVSATGITSASVPSIITYLTSPQAGRIETFKCNGNNLGHRGVRSIARALTRANFTLTKVEMHACGFDASRTRLEATLSGETSSDDDEVDGMKLIQQTEQMLRTTTSRNEILQRKTTFAAVALLPYARAVLLRPPRHSIRAHSDQADHDANARSLPASYFKRGVFPFQIFPVELQLHILSFLAPTLSSMQLVRIFNFASSSHTLPSLLPQLPGKLGLLSLLPSTPSSSSMPSLTADTSIKEEGLSDCVPDPSLLAFPSSNKSNPLFGLGMPSSGSGLCGNGKCMGAGNSLVCHRELKRSKWLEVVGCSQFELDLSGSNQRVLEQFL